MYIEEDMQYKYNTFDGKVLHAPRSSRMAGASSNVWGIAFTGHSEDTVKAFDTERVRQETHSVSIRMGPATRCNQQVA
jgi:hypothetical protein